MRSAVRRSLALLLIGLLAASCAASGTPPPGASAPVPTAAPTRVATTAPTASPTLAATSAPTTAPASTPTPAGQVLPHALYMLNEQRQLIRLERDGRTLTPITRERGEVLEFNVDRHSGRLAYVVNGDPDSILVISGPDGEDRQELFSGPVSQPLLDPGGERVLFVLDQPVPGLLIGSDDAPTGIWAQYLTGGRPSVYQPDDPVPDPNNPPPESLRYAPLSYAPDGARLLLSALPPVGEAALLAWRGPGQEIPALLDGVCCLVAWSRNSQSVLVAGGTFLQDTYPGLRRVELATGAGEELIPPQVNGVATLATTPFDAGDGRVLLFLAFSNEWLTEEVRVQMHALNAEGMVVPLRNDAYALVEALWAPDGSGAVVADFPADAMRVTLRWLPASGGPAVELGASGFFLQWGP